MARRRPLGPSCVISLLIPMLACGVVAPDCVDETGRVFETAGELRAGEVAAYTVMSPKSSNLVLRLAWTNGAAALGMRATITACGTHVGCAMLARTASGTTRWPPLLEMTVDGSLFKTYYVEVIGDPAAATSFALEVTYKIACNR